MKNTIHNGFEAAAASLSMTKELTVSLLMGEKWLCKDKEKRCAIEELVELLDDAIDGVKCLAVTRGADTDE